ncbi:MAG: Glycosyl transferase family 39 [Candidatus Amesbacteria bacterium GW2011_GWB1_47_19]|nr:MAG: Glycosyl transferase family 39 [Candidatus Amesbacteria bacterium GW2011_GWA1_44_24]KKU31349.1 MAG: Glycosyl transferase family 39 [Candidatus Amesbacteria bacterium GW2011_GWC1_46_24]KKU66998.1 MAG: Glycosyl transferase family 39 [Candidatus Amesbacteria bacterium GW2011_GWB1_47_19]OGD04841.1 MAG: hypothetical protein A2379_04725 [Candidatus Amesbacteria bacterium RIFOXYB1_FULL_47_13]HBC72783.1 hypothetical protein [Candidatus Amesbacteria bacterium]
MKNSKLPVILLILLAGILRFWDIGHNPPGVYVDEAHQGYNAYSLLKTGRDQYGMAWPVMTKLFGSYASSLYTYFSVVPIAILGLSAVSVRLVSALSGMGLVFLIAATFGPWAGWVVAVSPVFVFFSRGAFEANLGLFLFLIGFIGCLRASGRHQTLLPSFILLSISGYAYHAERLVSGLFIIFFSWYALRNKLHKKYIFPALAVSLVILVPLIRVSLYPAVNTRLRELAEPSGYSSRLLAYFSPVNLFSRPDPDVQRSFPEVSVFYWWMIIPFLAGVYRLIRARKLFLPGILVVFILPTALTRDYFSTVRVLPFFILLSLIIARGLSGLKPRLLWMCVLTIISLAELYPNLVLLKHERSNIWGYPYRQLASRLEYLSPLPVVIDNSRAKPLDILLAFYNRTDPNILQSRYPSSWIADYYDHPEYSPDTDLGKIQIRPIIWRRDVSVNQFLIGDQLAVSPGQVAEHHLQLVDQVTDINGVPVLFIYRTRPE